MKKIRIVIGSVLKPVDDIRHYHKLALSMAKTNKYEINIIGFKSKNRSAHPNIVFLESFSFKRLSVFRFVAPARFLLQIIKVKPELVIVNTPELLAVAVLYKILFGGFLMYDLQENYYLNIRYLSPLPKAFKWIAAFYIRFTEKLASRSIDHFLLAEKSYRKLSFVGRRYTVVENKSIVHQHERKQKTSQAHPTFLLTGTLSVNYGLKEAVEAFLYIKQCIPRSRMLICGKYHDDVTRKFVEALLASGKDVELQGGEEGVAYSVIRQGIERADYGLVFYPDNPAVNDCFPTKVWEYMACKLPMVLQPNRHWTSFCIERRAGVTFAPHRDPQGFASSLQATEFYPSYLDYGDVYWGTEETSLLAALDNLFEKKHSHSLLSKIL